MKFINRFYCNQVGKFYLGIPFVIEYVRCGTIFVIEFLRIPIYVQVGNLRRLFGITVNFKPKTKE